MNKSDMSTVKRPDNTGPTAGNDRSTIAQWPRRLMAKCGFELNYLAAGMFLAGAVALAYGIYSTLAAH